MADHFLILLLLLKCEHVIHQKLKFCLQWPAVLLWKYNFRNMLFSKFRFRGSHHCSMVPSPKISTTPPSLDALDIFWANSPISANFCAGVNAFRTSQDLDFRLNSIPFWCKNHFCSFKTEGVINIFVLLTKNIWWHQARYVGERSSGCECYSWRLIPAHTLQHCTVGAQWASILTK